MSETIVCSWNDAAFIEFATLKDAGEALARDAAGWLEAALAEKGAAFMAVPGGSSPGPFFRTLAEADLDWSDVRLTLTDERFVPEDSGESNSGSLRRMFLQHSAAAVHFVMPDMSNPDLERVAAQWDLQIRAAPAFDLVVLGMGEDGHFASLFPGSVALAEGLDLHAERFALAAPDKSPQRLSLTLHALTRTQHLAFLIAGAVKRSVIESALRGEPSAANLPICSLLRQSPVKPVFYWGAVS
jgi:6-phosphogluconolactonase